MSTPTLESIRRCLEGIVPGAIATTDAQGMPNVTYVSQALYMDPGHIALSFQFFNKTRQNILLNPRAAVLLMDPETTARFRLQVQYLRTETSGPLFEKMRAKLAGIASHEGMEGIFVLRGADVYRVQCIEHLPGAELPTPGAQPNLLAALRASGERLACQPSLEPLVDALLCSLGEHFRIEHSMLLMADSPANKLYTVASRGYPESGVGAEIPFGVGVIGVAARERVPIRLMFAAADYVYTRAVRESAIRAGLAQHLEASIPLPGLPAPASQIAVPVLHRERLLAVLYAESDKPCRFDYDMEDALVILCTQFGLALQELDGAATEPPAAAAPMAPTPPDSPPVTIQYYSRDHSVFVDRRYLIKGVAGAILWRLLNQYQQQGRMEFTNRELRRDPGLPLPDIGDNLEARLLLLTRRLREHCAFLQLEKPGRGRIHLRVARPIQLQPQVE